MKFSVSRCKLVIITIEKLAVNNELNKNKQIKNKVKSITEISMAVNMLIPFDSRLISILNS